MRPASWEMNRISPEFSCLISLFGLGVTDRPRLLLEFAIVAEKKPIRRFSGPDKKARLSFGQSQTQPGPYRV